MKLHDKETLNIADAVKDVLEGKKPVAEMKSTDHVSKDGDSYVVKKMDGTVVKSFDSKDEAEAYAEKNHTDLMKEAGEPEAKGEKEFKAKHAVKKTGANDKGEVSAEGTLPPALQKAIDKKNGKKNDEEEVDEKGNLFLGKLNAARKNGDKDFVVAGKKYLVKDQKEDDEEDDDVNEAVKKTGKGKVTIDIDYIGDKTDAKNAEKKHKLKIKFTGRGTADVSGEKKDIAAFLSGDMYGMDSDDMEDLFPELYEGNVDEMNDKQAAYKAFFQKALKKFKVKDPSELGDRKKEFFDYVDANYNSEEEPGKDGVKEGLSDIVGKIKDKVKGVDREKIKKLEDKLADLKDGDARYKRNFAKAKAEFKAGKFDKEAMRDKDDFYNDAMNNNDEEIANVIRKIKAAKAGKDGVKEDVNEDVKRAAKEYANSVAKLETLRKNISDTQSNKFKMKTGGQDRIDGWKKNIESEKKYMQKLKDKWGSGVTKSDTFGFSGGA